jgi:hypothetical protein
LTRARTVSSATGRTSGEPVLVGREDEPRVARTGSLSSELPRQRRRVGWRVRRSPHQSPPRPRSAAAPRPGHSRQRLALKPRRVNVLLGIWRLQAQDRTRRSPCCSRPCRRARSHATPTRGGERLRDGWPAQPRPSRPGAPRDGRRTSPMARRRRGARSGPLVGVVELAGEPKDRADLEKLRGLAPCCLPTRCLRRT